MKKIIPILFLALWGTLLAAQAQPQAYKIVDHKGKKSSYQKMLKEIQKADIVFFGELHNNPISHWLELEIARDLYAQESDNLVLGGEMFETDNQILINEYFLGFISARSFKKETRVWSNYDTDYKPLIEFAKENNLDFVASNVPRRYASMVYKQGLSKLEALPDYSKIYLPPLPIKENFELDCYKQMLEDSKESGSETPERYPQAQMIKDATMAHFIYAHFEKGNLFLHYNGSFHSDNKEGIISYLRLLDPNLKIATITTVEQDNISTLESEHKGKADFIIVTPSRMTKTY